MLFTQRATIVAITSAAILSLGLGLTLPAAHAAETATAPAGVQPTYGENPPFTVGMSSLFIDDELIEGFESVVGGGAGVSAGGFDAGMSE